MNMKKKHLFKAIVSSILSVTLLASYAFSAFATTTTDEVTYGENLVVNGTFDDDTGLDQWSCWFNGESAPKSIATGDDNNPYLAIECFDDASWSSYNISFTDLKPNTDYFFEMSVKCEVHGHMGIEAKTAEMTGYDQMVNLAFSYEEDKFNQWENFTYTVNTGDYTTLRFMYKISQTTTDNVLCFDNVSLREVLPTAAPVFTLDYEAVNSTSTQSEVKGTVDINCALSYKLNGGESVAVELTKEDEGYSFTTGAVDLISGENEFVFTADNGLTSTETIKINRIFVESQDSAYGENLVIDGNFDEGTGVDQWGGWFNGNPPVKAIKTDEDDNPYLEIECFDGASWTSYTMSVADLKPHTDYKFKIKVLCGVDWKMDIYGKNATKDLAIKDNAFHWDKLNPTEWQEYEYTFNTDDYNTARFMLKVPKSVAGDLLKIDNVSLREVLPTAAPVFTLDYEAVNSTSTQSEVTGKVDTYCNVSYTLNDGSNVALVLTEEAVGYSFTTGMVDVTYGDNTFVFTADNGKVSTETVVINRTYEKEAEMPGLVVDASDDTTYQSTYYIGGSVDNSAKLYYTFNDGTETEVEDFENGQFVQKLDLVEGANTIVIKAVAFENGKEYAEKTETKTVTINYVTEKPDYNATEETEKWNWDDVNLAGMGWVSGVISSETAPYQMYCKTDVGGMYIYDRDEEEWVSISMSFGVDERGTYNVDSFALDPKDGNTIYFIGNGTNANAEVWVSEDAGQTWTGTGLSSKYKVLADGNDSKSLVSARNNTGERLAVDPNNSDIVFLGSRSDGAYRYDGTTWELITGLPTDTFSNGGYTFVTFDENGGTTTVDGKEVSKVIYIGLYDYNQDKSTKTSDEKALSEYNGVYRSVDGGLTWTKLENSPTSPLRGAVNDNGTLMVTSFELLAGNNGVVSMIERNENSFEEVLSVGKNEVSALSVMPDGVSFMVTSMKVENGIYYFENGTSTYTTKTQFTDDKIDYQNTDWCHADRGATAIDYSDPTGNTAFSGTGFGVVRTENFLASNVEWDDFTAGVGELCCNVLKVSGDDTMDLVAGVLDMAGFAIKDKDVVPSDRLVVDNVMLPELVGPEWNIPLTQITGLDYCFQYPKYMAYTGWHEFGWFSDFANKFGTTTDGGLNWDESSTIYDGKESAGSIAISSSNPYNMVWAPVNGILKYSTDFGETWANAGEDIAADNNNKSIMGYPTLYENNGPYWGMTQNLESDKVNGNVFYLFTVKNTTDAEFWVSKDGGANWTLTYEGYAGDYTAEVTDKINASAIPFGNVIANPVVEGDVFIAIKPAFNGDDSEKPFDYKPLWRSTDATCTDFEKVENVQLAIDLSYGKGDSKENPYIYLLGRANNDTSTGVYVSRDNGEIWIRITDDSMQFGNANSIEADIKEMNLVYVGSSGSGIYYGKGEEDTTPDYDYGFKDVYEGDKVVAKDYSNMLVNGDFEGPNLNTWYSFAGGGDIAKVNTVKSQGSNSLAITGKKNTWGGVAQAIGGDTVNFFKGEKYAYSVKVKLAEGTTGGNLELALEYQTGEYDSSKGWEKDLLASTMKFIEGTDWVEISGTFTLDKDISGVQIKISEPYANDGKSSFENFYIDEVKLNLISEEMAAAKELETAKEDVIAEIEKALAEYAEDDYREDQWGELVKIFDDAKVAVNAMTVIADVNTFDVAGLTTSADEIETDAELKAEEDAILAKELADAKEDLYLHFISMINEYSEDDYREDEWAELVKIFADAKAEVEALTDIKDVQDFDKLALSNKADEIKTDAELTAEELKAEELKVKELAEAKQALIAEIETAFAEYNKDDYREDEWAELVKIFEEAKLVVNGMSMIADVDSYEVAGLTVSADEVKTDAELKAEEDAQAKPDVPTTGDNSSLLIVMSVLTISLFGALTILRNKVK